MSEVMFRRYLMLPVPDVMDPRAVALGHLAGDEGPVLAMGGKSGTMQLFITGSHRPWYEAELKGTVVCVKLAALFGETRLLAVTLEGNFYMFNVFDLQRDYERDRLENEKQNDQEAKLAETLEEEDAEALLNELEQPRAPERREAAKANAGFRELHGNTKRLDVDLEDRVACNCSLLEVEQVFDGDGLPKDTIFMGTYDGSLSALRLTTKSDEKSEFYQLTPIRKWDFSSAVLSMITFGIHRPDDPLPGAGKSTTRFGSHLQKQQAP